MGAKKNTTRKPKQAKPFLLEQDLLQPLYLAAPAGLPASKLPKNEGVTNAANEGLVEKKTKGKSVSFAITAAGEKRLWQWWPLERKIEEMRKRQQHIDARLAELHKQCQDLADWAKDSELAQPSLSESFNELERGSAQATAAIREILDTLHGKEAVIAVGENYLRRIAEARARLEQECRQWQQSQEKKLQDAHQQSENDRNYILHQIADLREQVKTLSDFKGQPAAPAATPLTNLVAQITATPPTVTVAPATVLPATTAATTATDTQAAGVVRPIEQSMRPMPQPVAKSVAPPVTRPATPSIAPVTAPTRQLAPTIAPAIDEARLTQAMARAYRRLITMRSHASCVKLPDLYEAVRLEFPNLTIATYKEVLLRLHQQVVIDLISVNEKREMEKPEFGIPAQLGEFYYVVWR